MSTKLDALRKRLRQAHSGQQLDPTPQDTPIKIVHAHCDKFCYLRLEPSPPNGIVKMTPTEYAACIAEMQKVLVSFKEKTNGR